MFENERFNKKYIASLCREYDQLRGVNQNLRTSGSVIDGLKIIGRRLMYVMYLDGAIPSNDYNKVIEISGSTAGKLHHHSSITIVNCLVSYGEWWTNNIPLIDGYGNYGSVCGNVAAAERYILARLSPYAYDCFFSEWKDSAVDMVLGANNKTFEPLYLPAKYPNILVNGIQGMGYGEANTVPPFNFRELIETCILLMKNPNADFVLIPDSPTRCDILEGDFRKINNTGCGTYKMRCTYKIHPEQNMICIDSLPYQVKVNNIRERIADIKESGGLTELTSMDDLSGDQVNLQLFIKDTANPYKFIKKLIEQVKDLEKTFISHINVAVDYSTIDMNIREVLLEWIRYRREQKRAIYTHKKTKLLAEQRTNDVKIFLMDKNNLQNTINLFITGKNRITIEKRLIEEYGNSNIHMDSLQAKTLSDLRLHELSTETYEKCLKRRDELIEELKKVDDILLKENGIDDVIIGELRDGAKKFGAPRRSNVIPEKISIDTEIDEVCILQISNGIILRKIATNVDEEPVPIDNNGFAIKVNNDSAFILIDEQGHHSAINVKELPVDQEVPLNRYIKRKLNNIIAVLPFEDDDKCCTLISAQGIIKKIKISDFRVSNKPCIDINKNDKLINGIVTKLKTIKDILVYTKNGMGQRFDPNHIKTTSMNAKGMEGFKLNKDDEIIGCYDIRPDRNQYLLYITTKGKVRLNAMNYLPIRKNKHDEMLRLIPLNERDTLISIIGCNRNDQVEVYFQDSDSEIIEVKRLEETTMSMEPKKVTDRNAVSNIIVKVKLL